MAFADIHGDDALDAFAEMIEPASELLADEEIRKGFKSGKTGMINVVRAAVKNHKAALIRIMAIYNGEDAEEFKRNITPLTLPVVAVKMLNEPEVQELFFGQSAGKTQSSASTAASDGTLATEKE